MAEIVVNKGDLSAADELCNLWIPLSRREEVAEIIAKHRMQLSAASVVTVVVSDGHEKVAEYVKQHGPTPRAATGKR